MDSNKNIPKNTSDKSIKNIGEGLGPTGIFILIILFFMFSNKLIDIFWDIAKSLLYLILLIFGLNIINPTLSTKLRSWIMDLIDIDSENNFLKDALMRIYNMLKIYIQDSVNNINTKSEQQTLISQSEINQNNLANNNTTLGLPKKDLKTIENRDLQSSTDTNNRRLIQ